MSTKAKTDISATVQRAVRIMNYLNDASGPQGISNISHDLGLSTTIVHRLLNALKQEGMVFQDPQSKRYSLGSVLLDYANKLLAEMPFATLIEPWLRTLRDRTEETVGFYIPSGNVRICAMEFESLQEIRRSVGVGRRIPLHLGASGRAILAFMSEEVQQRILDALEDREKEQVLKRLEQTKNDGYSTNEEEITPNVSALSAPVFDPNGRVLGALSISGPSFRWNRRTMEPSIPVLREAVREVTQSFG